MLHKEYGFAVYEMTPKDMEIIHAFIFSTPTRLKPSVFLDKKFYLFDILLMLSWRGRIMMYPYHSLLYLIV